MAERFAIDLMSGVRELFEAASKQQLPRLAWWDDASPLSAISVTVGTFGEQEFTFSNAVRDLSVWQAVFEHEGSPVRKIRSAADLDAPADKRQLGVLLNLQNTTHFGRRLEDLYTLVNLGVRQVQLTYNERNAIGDGCLEKANGGLTAWGCEVVRALNRVGVAIDVSHCGHRTTLHAAETSERPLMASHTGAWRLYAHPRNKTDDELRAIAETGGVIGVYAVPFFLAERNATVDTLIQHVIYIANLVGIEHVAIGTDRPDDDPNERDRETWEAFWQRQTFSGARDEAIGASWPPFLDRLRYLGDWNHLLDALSRRGLDDASIRAVAGGNARRFLRQVLPGGVAAADRATTREPVALSAAGVDAGGRA